MRIIGERCLFLQKKTMNMVRTIGVFCSAAENIDRKFFDSAHEVGAWMAQQGITLVYGGAAMGLMEEVARGVKSGGGHTVGVVPNRLVQREVQSSLLDEVVLCGTLAERKQLMLERSDLLLALPGGIGTLDEVFHVMGSATIGEHRKRVVLYNIDGFWDECMGMLSKMNREGFIRGRLSDYVVTAASVGEILAPEAPQAQLIIDN